MGVDTRGNLKNALRRSQGRYMDDLCDSQGSYPAFSGLTAVTLTADTTLALKLLNNWKPTIDVISWIKKYVEDNIKAKL